MDLNGFLFFSVFGISSLRVPAVQGSGRRWALHSHKHVQCASLSNAPIKVGQFDRPTGLPHVFFCIVANFNVLKTLTV